MTRSLNKTIAFRVQFTLLILMSFGLIRSAAAAAGTWTKLTHQPPAAGVALLLTDGTVMVESSNTTTWYKLTPDAAGSYVNGTWSQLASMHDSRQFFASVVLNDGRVLVGGGEYGSGGSTVEIYDPSKNTWSYVSSWPGYGIFDSTAKVLPDGRVLLLPYSGSTNYIYDPINDTWTITGYSLDRNDEESVVQLPDGTFLCVEIPNAPQTAKYTPATGQWTSAAALPIPLVSQGESGAGLLLYDGRAMFLGASGNTAFYTNSTNSWQAGPVIPNGMNSGDKTAAVMPNGHVLMGAGSSPADARTSAVFDFDPVALTYVNTVQPISFSYFLVLPSGQVLANGLSSGSYVYTPAGVPAATWKPTISSIKQNPDGSYSVYGTQLNGLTEGAAFGDDAQMASNYPIVRLVSGNNASYAKSYGFSTMGVATGGALEGANFTTAIPANGTYSLSVIASGVASDPVPFQVFGNVPPPVISSATTLSTIENVKFNYTIAATNGANRFNATGLPAGLSIGGPYIYGTPTVAGTFNIHLSATNAGGTGTATLVLTIKPTPVIKSPLAARADVGTPNTYTIAAINNPTSFNATGLPPGMAVNTSTGVISGTPTTTGSWTVTLSASNASGTGQATLNFTVNPAPTITTASLASGTTGTAYSQKVAGSGGTVPYTWTISSGALPAGLTLGPAGTIAGTPTTAGDSNFTVKLTDLAGGVATHNYAVTINGLSITSKATANPNPALVGENLSYTVAAGDSDGDTLAYSWVFGDGATAAGASATHAYTAVGNYVATVTVSDGHGSTVSSSVTVTVNAAIVAPVITSALTASGTVGTAFSYTIAAKNNPTRFNATSLPAGLSVNTATGVISGTPTVAGSSNVTISATNAGGTGSATLVLTINAAPPAQPVITSPLTASGTVGTRFGYNIRATNNPSRYNAVGVPPGLSFIVTPEGAAIITGTPATAGTFSVTISATNAGGTGSAALVITIAASGGAAAAVPEGSPATITAPPPAAIPMTISKLRATVHFTSSGHDICTLSGTIPNLPAQFNPAGQQLLLNVGGVSATFTLDAKGRGKSALGSVVLQLKLKRDKATGKSAFPGGNVPFTAKLQAAASTWASVWGIDPSTTSNTVPTSMTVSIQLGNNTYTAAIPATVRSKAQVGATISK